MRIPCACCAAFNEAGHIGTGCHQQVMGYMKRMARDNGHIVIASIHQPRSAIWSMFDTVRAAAGHAHS